MKKIISIITLVIIAFGLYAQDSLSSGGGGGSGSSSSITALPMIKSQDALRNYALGIARMGSRNVYAQSLDWDWPERVSYTNMAGAYGEEILDKLFNVEFVYRLTNPEDQISGYVYLYDGNSYDYGNCLFWGYASYTLADLKTNKPQYNIWMQNIPLPPSNIQSAEVLALDEDGKTARRYPLQINNGQMLFQPWMAGAPNGILTVRFNDGSLVTYDLASPVGEVPTGSGESASYKVDGHYIYTTDQKGGLPTVRIMEMWQRPSVFLEITTAPQVATLDVIGVVQEKGMISFERPVSMEVIPQGKDTGWTIPLNGDSPTEVNFPVGQYRIRFNWINFGKPNMIYTGPDSGIGVGVVSSTTP